MKKMLLIICLTISTTVFAQTSSLVIGGVLDLTVPEAGSAGKDTRGMQRLHEFHKVELVRLCTPEMVEDEFKLLVSDAERRLKMLGLPYRVLDLCGGDITFSSTRVHDLEVYSAQ